MSSVAVGGADEKERSHPSKILGFNGLRGCSVIAVYLSHKCGVEFFIGALGVWTFLSLSGFLIIGELHRQRIAIDLRAEKISSAYVTFFIKRAIRIFPAYYSILAVLFIFRHYYEWAGTDLGFRYHLAYASNFWLVFVYPSTGPFGVLWTLATEQQFYVVAPFLLLFVPSRLHLKLLAGLLVIMAAGHLMMVMSGAETGTLYILSPWNYATIVLGGVGYILLQQPRCEQIVQSRWFFLLSMATIAAFAASWLVTRQHDPQQPLFVFAVTAALAGFLCWVRCNQHSIIVRTLEWRPIEYLGVISYGFYLIHNFVPNPLGRLLPLYFGLSVDNLTKVTIGAAFGFTISVILAHLSWTFLERPILSYKRQFVMWGLRMSHREDSRVLPDATHR